MKTLIVVESPTKAKHIRGMLGPDYILLATFGHIKDLPPKELGIDMQTLEPQYVTVPGKQKTINMIKEAANQAKDILLATDPDREGEAISWHVYESLPKKCQKRVQRVEFREITKEGVRKGLASPRSIHQEMVQSQQARRMVDRLAGFKLSPILWKHIKGRKGLSAGRVQSAALKLLYDRSKEINAFVPEEYYEIEGLFQIKGHEIPATLTAVNQEKVEIRSKQEAEELCQRIQGSSFFIADIQTHSKFKNPPEPFITGTLLEEAHRKLKFTSQKTLKIAQQLFEGIAIHGKTEGVITYMRTDSTRIAPEAKEAAKQYIAHHYGSTYVAAPSLKRKKTAGVQDAHEAIRPTDLLNDPGQLFDFLTKDQYQLYELIYQRFLASQMAAATFEYVEIEIEGRKDNFRSLFRSLQSKILFDGYRIAYQDSEPEEERIWGLEQVTYDSQVKEKQLVIHSHYTRPPAFYSEATLVKKLRNLGIGRPSTYGSIIQTLLQREYMEQIKQQLVITDLGNEVIQVLLNEFPTILDYKFTSDMEKALDDIADGSMNWDQIVKEFNDSLKEI
jgi:DNA topoisomerase I